MPRAAACLLLAALAVLGCGKRKQGDGASCDEVGARFLTLSQQQLDTAKAAGDVDDKTFSSISNHLPPMRDSIVRACKESTWPAETRDCFAGAANDRVLEACYETMPADQRAKLEESSAAATTKPGQ